MASIGLVRRGLRVALVDKAPAGRGKVCGCCLGLLGLHCLREHGLASVTDGATHLDTLRLGAGGRFATMGAGGMVAISRERLDASLAQAAADEGVRVLRGVRATADDSGAATLRGPGWGARLRVGVVVMACGLNGEGGARAKVARRARIGLGTTADDGAGEPGELAMALGRGGYVGRVTLEDGRVDWAAAMDPRVVRRAGGPARAIGAVWRDAGLRGPTPPEDGWRGTPTLWRRRRARQGRILRVGDAAGYVEPLTGEGMSWALVGGWAVAPHAAACAAGAADAGWEREHARLLRARRARCAAVALGARSAWLGRAAVGLGRGWPALGTALSRLASGGTRWAA